MNNNRAFQNYYLETYIMCKDFNCLPYAGGLLDQPAIFVEAFKIISEITREYQAMKGGGKHG